MIRTRTKILAAVSLMFLGFSALAGAEELEQRVLEGSEVIEFLDETVPTMLEQFNVPGVTISVVQGSETLAAKAYGFSDFAAQQEADAESSVFRIGSISKLFTWTALMQLVEQGKVNLDADVNTYLTDFQVPDTFEEPVTIRHLLTHTGAFEDGGLGWLFEDSADKIVPLAEFLQAHVPVRYGPPGQFSTYSNWGAALAGHIIEIVSGMEFDDYVEKNIFEPLGMMRSTFREPVPEDLESDRAVGHKYDGEHIVAGYQQYLHSTAPTGAMRSTAIDMAKFMVAHLNGGRVQDSSILKPETVAEMHRTQFSPHPAMRGMGYGFMMSDINGHEVSGHSGSTSYFHANVMLVQAARVGFFASFNGEPGRAAIVQLSSAFMNRFFPPVDGAIETTAYEATDDELFKMEGLYKPLLRSYSTWNSAMFLIMDDISINRGADDHLVASTFGPPTTFRSVAPFVIQEIGGDAMRAFRVDSSGSVTHMFDSSFSAVALEKISYVESGGFFKLLGVFASVIALTTLIAPLQIWRSGGGGQRSSTMLMVASAILIPAAFWLFLKTYLGAGHDVLIVSVPFGIKAALTAPLIVLVFTVVSIYLQIKAWRSGTWSVPARCHHGLGAVVLIVFLVFCDYWNILGYRFG